MKSRALEYLKELISLRPETPERANMAVEKIAEWLREFGKDPQVFEFNGHKSLLLRQGKVLLNSHVDTVPTGEGWTKEFTHIEDGKLYGRGAADALGCAASMVAVAQETNASLMIVSDEEVGGFDGTAKLLERFHPEFAIVGEPTFLKLNVRERGIIWPKVTVKGKSAHAGRPWLGKNAIYEFFERHKKFMEELRAFKKSKHYKVGASASLTKIKAGTRNNVIPEKCEGSYDIRFSPEISSDLIKNILERIFPSVEYIIDEPAFEANLSHPITKKLLELVQETYSEYESSDARHFARHKINTIVFGVDGGNWHGPDEWVSVESIKKYIEILKKIVD